MQRWERALQGCDASNGARSIIESCYVPYKKVPWTILESCITFLTSPTCLGFPQFNLYHSSGSGQQSLKSIDRRCTISTPVLSVSYTEKTIMRLEFQPTPHFAPSHFSLILSIPNIPRAPHNDQPPIRLSVPILLLNNDMQPVKSTKPIRVHHRRNHNPCTTC